MLTASSSAMTRPRANPLVRWCAFLSVFFAALMPLGVSTNVASGGAAAGSHLEGSTSTNIGDTSTQTRCNGDVSAIEERGLD